MFSKSSGTRWIRADFHLHTRADKEFKYEGKENDFVNQYVAKLVEEKIGVGIITNHNKFDKDEYKAIAKNARKKGIYVLPGVELSVKDGANGVHTLIIFDPDQWLVDGSDFINQFISSNYMGMGNYENENRRSHYNLEATLSKLERLNKNYFVVMAHVEQNSGLLHEFEGGRIIELGKNPLFRKSVLGFQKVRSNDMKKKLCQWLGDNVPYYVEGSDPKCIDEIGKGEACYIKIGDFNFEAVKYALLDHHNRCSDNDNHNPANSYINTIAFDGGLLDGKKIYFSPELNSLIGIRGSGKSSILEIIRYALNIPLGSQAVDAEYKDDLIRHVLGSGGKVVVEIVDRHSATYRIERIYGQNADIYKDNVLQQGISLDAILRQPIYFGQKDLSNKNDDFENDLVNKLIGSKLNKVQERIRQQEITVRRIINEMRSYNNLSLLKKETETVKSNAEHKLNLFKEKGIDKKLQQQTSFESDLNSLRNYLSNIDTYLRGLQSVISDNEYALNNELQSKTNVERFEEANTLVSKIKLTLEKLKNISTDIKNIRLHFVDIISKLEAKKEELKEEFARVKREIDIPDLNPDDFIKINRELETSKFKLIEIEKSEGKRIELERSLNEAITALDNLWHEKFGILKQEVNKINKVGGKLFIQVNYKGRKDKFQSKMQEVFRGSRINETTYNTISNEYADFIDMRRDNFRKLVEQLTDNQFVELKNRFEANLTELLTYKVEDQVIINFDGTSLNKHSLGQRASALILFLLSQQENDILIIDQPEDDLDNQTIYQDVIKEIKRLKGQMQFIFATHNANIPVLGDSEMIIACEYVPENEIKIEYGSIDCPEIQNKIIQIMEGGKEAFRMRKNIYTMWEIEK